MSGSSDAFGGDSFEEQHDPAESVPLEWLLGKGSGYFQPQRYASLSGSCRYEPKTETAAQKAFNRVQRSAIASGVLLRQEFAKDMGRKGMKLGDLISGTSTVVDNPDLRGVPVDRNKQWKPRPSKRIVDAGHETMRRKIVGANVKETDKKKWDVSQGRVIKRDFVSAPVVVQPLYPQPRRRMRPGAVPAPKKSHVTAATRGVNTAVEEDMSAYNAREDFKAAHHPQNISESYIEPPKEITTLKQKQASLLLDGRAKQVREAKNVHRQDLTRMARFQHKEMNEKFKTVASKRYVAELNKLRREAPKGSASSTLAMGQTTGPATFTIPSNSRGGTYSLENLSSWEEVDEMLASSTAPLVVAPDSVDPDRVGWKLPRTQSENFHLNRTDVFVFGGGFNAG